MGGAVWGFHMQSSSSKTSLAGRRLPRVCITGGIAAGKGLVGAVFAQQGVPVIDADQVCADLLGRGRPLYVRLRRAFGKSIVGADGQIQRAVLGRLVFNDPQQLEKLNRLMHPAAMRAIEAWVKQQRAASRGAAFVVAQVPLVYEAHWEQAWERIVCVCAPRPLQLERLRQRGLALAEARARIAAQWPQADKMQRADYVVFNAGTRPNARRQALEIYEDIKQHMEKKDGG